MRTFVSLDQMWRETCSELLSQDLTPSRNGPCREILGFQAHVAEPRGWCVTRKPSPVYAAGELLWYLSGSESGAQIVHYAPRYKNYLVPDGHGEYVAPGAYGARWAAQWRSILNLLKADIGTRQAVLTTFRAGDIDTCGPDKPCTLTLQFIVRDEALHLIATMRSNDAWLGLPYDSWCFTRIQMLVAAELGVSVGSYVHQVGSMHLYCASEDKARARLNAPCRALQEHRVHHHMAAQGDMLNSMLAAASIEAQVRSCKPSNDAERAALFAEAERCVMRDFDHRSMFRQVVLLAAMRSCGMRRSAAVNFAPMWDASVQPDSKWTAVEGGGE